MEKQIKQTKTTKFTKCLRKTLLGVLVCGIIYSLNVGYNKLNTYMDTKNYVEPYCSIRYQHNVEEYKSCKDLTPTKLIQKLTEEQREKSTHEIVDLPMLKI